jgi:hypothetical protein
MGTDASEGTSGEWEIECPGHGPMFRLYHPKDPGLLLNVYCRQCGKHPIGLLEAVRLVVGDPAGDAEASSATSEPVGHGWPLRFHLFRLWGR